MTETGREAIAAWAQATARWLRGNRCEVGERLRRADGAYLTSAATPGDLALLADRLDQIATEFAGETHSDAESLPREKLADSLRHAWRTDASQRRAADERYAGLEPRARLALEVQDLWRTGSSGGAE